MSAATPSPPKGLPAMPDFDPDRVRKLARDLRVEPGSRVRLPHDRDPHDDAGIREADAGKLLREGRAAWSEYQARLAAQDRVKPCS